MKLEFTLRVSFVVVSMRWFGKIHFNRYLAVWVVFGVLLRGSAIRRFEHSVELSSFVNFLATMDTATTS